SALTRKASAFSRRAEAGCVCRHGGGAEAGGISDERRERDDAVRVGEFAAAPERSGADFREESGTGSDGNCATAKNQSGKKRSPRCGAAAGVGSGDIDRNFPEEIAPTGRI